MKTPEQAHAEILAEKGLTLSLFEILATLYDLVTEPADPDDLMTQLLPTAARVGHRAGRSAQGGINGLLALRSRGLADNWTGDYGDSDRWTVTGEGERIMEAAYDD